MTVSDHGQGAANVALWVLSAAELPSGIRPNCGGCLAGAISRHAAASFSSATSNLHYARRIRGSVLPDRALIDAVVDTKALKLGGRI